MRCRELSPPPRRGTVPRQNANSARVGCFASVMLILMTTKSKMHDYGLEVGAAVVWVILSHEFIIII